MWQCCDYRQYKHDQPNRRYIKFMLLLSMNPFSCGFELSPVCDSITSTYGQNVDLFWDCKDIVPREIRFTRGNFEDDNKTKFMAEWNSNTGINIDIYYATHLKFDYNSTSGRITLTLRDTRMADFNKKYYCHIIKNVSETITSSINLTAEVPRYNFTNRVNVRIEEEATLKLQYTYRYLAGVITFRQKNRENGDIIGAFAYWYYGTITENSPFKGRMNFTKVLISSSSEIITLVIYNITKTDLDHIYECHIVLTDGQSITVDFYLLEKKEIEAKSQSENISQYALAFWTNILELYSWDEPSVVAFVIFSLVLFIFIVIVVIIYLIWRKTEVKFLKFTSNRNIEREFESGINGGYAMIPITHNMDQLD